MCKDDNTKKKVVILRIETFKYKNNIGGVRKESV